MEALKKRQDVLVLGVSFCFIAVYIGLVFAIGEQQGWKALDPVTHPDSDRFIPKPNRTCSQIDEYGSDYGAEVRKASVDCYSKWYYWQLPPIKSTPFTRAIVWILFLVHLLTHWALLAVAQADKQRLVAEEKAVYSGRLRWYNWALVVLTFLFYSLHLIQSHTTYDALAKDVAIQSSQGSVIVALIFVMCIEYRDRGVFLGWPSQYSTDRVASRVRLSTIPMAFVRKYHGYAIAWAMIYTFWYHPMENTYGHATGTIHTFISTIQGSLVYQKIHLNKYWRFFLETWVWMHGSSVAVMVATGQWWTETSFWMFFLGFGTLVFLTQLYGLPFWQHISPWFRLVPFPVWLIATVAVILSNKAISNGALSGLVTIPLGQIACMFATWLIIYGFYHLFHLLRVKPSNVGGIGAVVAHCAIYGGMTVFFWVLHAYGTAIDLPFIAGTYVLVFIALIAISLSWFLAPLPDLLDVERSQKSEEQPPTLSTVTPAVHKATSEV